MSDCDEYTMLLHGLIDGELDAANGTRVEAHIKTCARCAAEIERLETVRARIATAEMRYPAPLRLLGRVEAQIDAETSPASQRRAFGRVPGVWPGVWFAGGVISTIAASFALFIAVPQLSTRPLQDQIVASHMRSLLAAHLTDVATSNQHVVKPWFNGRIDFAVPVADLADQGFPLVGGRLDYLENSVVPALVFKRRLHTINLFIRPDSTAIVPSDFTASRRGFNIVRWTSNGLEYWAVSDLSAADLQTFRSAFTASAP
jgi:anti-sigma factor RsiW